LKTAFLMFTVTKTDNDRNCHRYGIATPHFGLVTSGATESLLMHFVDIECHIEL